MKRLLLALSLLFWAAPSFAATGTITPSPFQVVLDNNGDPINLACVWTYVAGSSTLASTYTDVTLNTANANPIVVGPSGRYTAFLVPGSSYKFVYESPPCSAISHGSVLVTADNISAMPASSSTLDVLGVAGEALTAGQVVYLSDGSGSKTAGQWFKASANNNYSSLTPVVAMTTADIASGATGSMRLSGSVPSLSGLVVGANYYVSSTGGALSSSNLGRFVGQADSVTSLVAVPNPPPSIPDNGINDFHLTLTTGTCNTTADVTAATTIYLAPCGGNRIVLFDASGNGSIYTSAQISIAVPAVATQMYDLFAYASSGSVTLEALAWTNDTTRATAVVNTMAVGVYTKSGDATRRYVGSFRTLTSGQTEDSFAKRMVWSANNRVRIGMRNATETSDSWAYTLLTWRQANANTANQIAFIVGIAGSVVDITAVATVGTDGSGAVTNTGIGLDSTSALASGCLTGHTNAGNAQRWTAVSRLTTIPAVGYHTGVWLESSAAAGTTTWYGDNGNASFFQSGISGVFER